jgi:S-adenosylmethionine:diacylglycerol 3-amino-3-carboxypropyl transferase
MKSFFETINYTSSNEDSRSELLALQLKSADSVLCVTGSGARTLDLLIEGPAEIVSIDFNPCQNFLLELKMVALRHLEYEEFLEFIGIRSSPNREYVYQTIKDSLSAEAKDFWDRQSLNVKKGIIYSGRWEIYFSNLARIIQIWHPRLLKRLFNCNDVEEQARVWHKEWDSSLWRLFMRCVSSRIMWRYIFGDPGFYQYVPDKFSIFNYFVNRFNAGFEHLLVNESPFVSLLFWGKYDEEKALPLYLQKKYYKTLKERLSCVQVVTKSLVDYLIGCEENRFNAYSLSDFTSYTNFKEYEIVWQRIVRTALDGARACERQFLVKREIPLAVKSNVTRIESLENELTRTDDSLFYTFIVAHIKKE